MKYFLTILLPLAVLSIFYAPTAHAVCTDNIIPDLGCQTQVRPNAGSSGYAQLNGTLNTLWGRIMTVIFLGMGIIAVIMLVTAGIQYIASAGNPEGVKKARQQIINVVLAIVLLTTSYFIIGLIWSAVRALSN